MASGRRADPRVAKRQLYLDPLVKMCGTSGRRRVSHHIHHIDRFFSGRTSFAVDKSLPRDAYTGPNKLELHEVILDSGRPDLEPEPHNRPFAIHGTTA